MIIRKKTKIVKIGNIAIGGNNPIAVQTMLSVPSGNIKENVAMAIELQKAGCEILRVSVPEMCDIKLIEALKNAVTIPVVADIHFDYKIAIEAAAAGADKIRINPGNIGSDDRVKQVVNFLKQKNIPIRIGVNSGSLEKEILAKYGTPTPQALVESAMYHLRLLEKYDFDQVVISIKSSNVLNVINAYSLLSEGCDYPLHLGVTEAGQMRTGLVKSAIGIGELLLKGIGDTIRVSLTEEPINEVLAGFDILRAVGYDVAGAQIISCPTCGRTKINVKEIAQQVENMLLHSKTKLTVAVMGCVVNGPGEAKEADIGIAGGDGTAVLFKKGKQIRVINGDIINELLEEIKSMKEVE